MSVDETSDPVTTFGTSSWPLRRLTGREDRVTQNRLFRSCRRRRSEGTTGLLIVQFCTEMAVTHTSNEGIHLNFTVTDKIELG